MNTFLTYLQRFLLWLTGASAAETPTVAAPGPLPSFPAPGPALENIPSVPFRAPTAPPEASIMPQTDPINDAADYGVAVELADVPEGVDYWQAVRVHHLTPEENHGNHHIYLDALDEAGARIFGAQAHITWDGGEETVTIDKPVTEPGTNFPMWKWQICALEMIGLPSDRVTNLHTAHPDEPPGAGNTLFHHSFLIDFQRTVKGSTPPPPPPPPVEESEISGAVSNAENLTLQLTRDGTLVDSAVLDAAGLFSFTGLAAGTYLLRVAGTDVQSDSIELDGSNRVTVNLIVSPVEPPSPSDRPIEGYMLFGRPEAPRTAVMLVLARESLLRERFAFGFSQTDAAQADKVVVIGGPDDVSQATEDALVAAGCTVHRIQGDADEIIAALEGHEPGSHPVFLPTLPK